ncbi:MAG: triose-phosphate isomerase, partial [Nitrososphaerales archaeon]
ELDRLSSVIESVSGAFDEETSNTSIFLAIPAFELRYSSVKFPQIKFLAQHIDDAPVGSTTGFLVPEIAKASGARGSLVNHSEHRLDKETIENIVSRLRNLGMISVVCAKDDAEVATFAKFGPDFIAIEPPELIGSGIAVSKVRPEIISNSQGALERSKPTGSKTKLLCGAGIVDETDARHAIELGAEGILVASGVVKARIWNEKIEELLRGISGVK